jgi:hypothetical protein
MDVLYGGLERSKLQFFYQKRKKKFLHEWDPDSLEMLDPEPDLGSMNPDPQH